MKTFSIGQIVGSLVLALIGLYGGVVLRGSPWEQSRDQRRSLPNRVSPAVQAESPQEFTGNEPLPIAVRKSNTPPKPQELAELEISGPKPQRANAAPESLPGPFAEGTPGMSSLGLPDNGRRTSLNLVDNAEIAQLMTQLREANDVAKKAELTKQL